MADPGALAGGLAYIAFHVARDLNNVTITSAWPYVLLALALLIALGFEFEGAVDVGVRILDLGQGDGVARAAQRVAGVRGAHFHDGAEVARAQHGHGSAALAVEHIDLADALVGAAGAWGSYICHGGRLPEPP